MATRKPKVAEAAGSATATSKATAVGASVEPLPADHPLYAVAGRIASEWAHIEHRLDTIIWMLLDTENKKAVCVTSQLLGTGPRCKAIIALGTVVGIRKKTLGKATELMQRASGAVEYRNRFAHDPLYLERPSGKAHKLTAMPYKDMQFGLFEVSQSYIDEAFESIKKIFDQTMRLRQAIRVELKSLREKPD